MTITAPRRQHFEMTEKYKIYQIVKVKVVCAIYTFKGSHYNSFMNHWNNEDLYSQYFYLII